MTHHEKKNPTQQRIDEDGVSDAPADVSWDEETWGERPESESGERTDGWPETVEAPHEGEEGQRNAA